MTLAHGLGSLGPWLAQSLLACGEAEHSSDSGRSRGRGVLSIHGSQEVERGRSRSQHHLQGHAPRDLFPSTSPHLLEFAPPASSSTSWQTKHLASVPLGTFRIETRAICCFDVLLLLLLSCHPPLSSAGLMVLGLGSLSFHVPTGSFSSWSPGGLHKMAIATVYFKLLAT